jgi:phenylpropionate dioxygenase-like ring-hydroxylating dioxygenase large terminal subunit
VAPESDRGPGDRCEACPVTSAAGCADAGLRYTLPAWVYRNEEFHELEKEHLLLPGWQIVCHVSEIAKAGDYVSFDFLGQRGFVVRDDSGAVRAFHNVCSHRAHAVVAGDRGHCNKF